MSPKSGRHKRARGEHPERRRLPAIGVTFSEAFARTLAVIAVYNRYHISDTDFQCHHRLD
jgi:hypothetical protein